ncbi:MAG TPA: hypothetical protein VNQ77_09320 [Frankiaceae bacterium]|nr:hypothetical protein [Frankiaceae bacterium]
MMRSLSRAAVALALPCALVSAPAAHADPCVETNTFNFSPPLGLGTTSGSMSGTHSNLCTTTTVPPTFYTSNGSIGTSYTGNCLVVLFGANTVSVLLASSVHVMVDVPARKAKVMPMVPTEGVCPTPSVTGTGLWVDA